MHGSPQDLEIKIDMAAPGAERIVDASPPWETIATDIIFGEGPVWDKRAKQLFFTDIIGDTVWKWRPGVGHEAILKPSHKANGLCLDLEGRLVVAGWGGRTVFRFEKDGSLKTLAARWEGKKLNSPNDIVVRSNGSIYFTDPSGGMLNVGMVDEDLQRYLDIAGVFRIAPDGTMSLVTADFVYPNGLCFSPDEKLLYVNCSRERLIRVYDVRPDGSVGQGRLFYQYTHPDRGNPDGLKCDVEGNVYCTGPGGVWVHRPDGSVLCRLKLKGHATNIGFGDDDWRSLYITMIGSVTRTRLKIPGVAAH
ncbi:MAG: SMP-30/gluconolactonase/LRE family protein [Betaproteobacteria bacterium]|nr:SMP-30/gluconolactonase/LRE family protein [Betaproteobacteria bacterium]